jgi:hypothetical protein
MNGVNALREQDGMTWIEDARAWAAAPAEVLSALATDGFEECKREMTTSRRDCQPSGGVWQGHQSAYEIRGVRDLGGSAGRASRDGLHRD